MLLTFMIHDVLMGMHDISMVDVADADVNVAPVDDYGVFTLLMMLVMMFSKKPR